MADSPNSISVNATDETPHSPHLGKPHTSQHISHSPGTPVAPTQYDNPSEHTPVHMALHCVSPVLRAPLDSLLMRTHLANSASRKIDKQPVNKPKSDPNHHNSITCFRQSFKPRAQCIDLARIYFESLHAIVPQPFQFPPWVQAYTSFVSVIEETKSKAQHCKRKFNHLNVLHLLFTLIENEIEVEPDYRISLSSSSKKKKSENGIGSNLVCCIRVLHILPKPE